MNKFRDIATFACVAAFLHAGCASKPSSAPPCFVAPDSAEDGITLLRDPYDLLHAPCGQDPALALEMLERRQRYFTCNGAIDLRWRILYAKALCRTDNHVEFIDVVAHMVRNGGNEQEHANTIMAYCSACSTIDVGACSTPSPAGHEGSKAKRLDEAFTEAGDTDTDDPITADPVDDAGTSAISIDADDTRQVGQCPE